MALRMTFAVIVSILGALSWYREHLRFERGKGIFHALSPEHGDWLLLAVVLLSCGTVLVIAWKEVSASPVQ